MAFTIDPDFSFKKVGTIAGRKDGGVAPNDAGETFARTLLRAGESPDGDKAPDTRSKEAAPVQPAAIIPLLQPEQQADPAPVPEGEEISLTAPAPDATAELVTDAPDKDAPSPDAAPMDAELLIRTPVQSASSDDEDAIQAILPDVTAETADAASATANGAETRTDQFQSGQPSAAQHPARHKTAEATDTDPIEAPQPDVQAAVAAAMAPVVKPTQVREGAGTATDIASVSSTTTAADTAPTPLAEASTRSQKQAEQSDASFEFAIADDRTSTGETTAKSANAHDAGKTSGTDGASPAPDATLMSATQPAPTTQSAPSAASAASAMTATHGVMVASPTETVRIITDSIETADDRKDQITVQLDPPELGRVSIDFKFDSRGLQHVTITGDNPEALRQLRLMHFELTQALERNGLSSENMTFQQQAHSGQQQQNPQPGTTARTLITATPADDSPSAPSASLAQPARPVRTASSGLDIKL